jgi:hypothetical protein
VQYLCTPFKESRRCKNWNQKNKFKIYLEKFGNRKKVPTFASAFRRKGKKARKIDRSEGLLKIKKRKLFETASHN